MSDIEELLTKKISYRCKLITNIPNLKECFTILPSMNKAEVCRSSKRSYSQTMIKKEEIDNIKKYIADDTYRFDEEYFSLNSKINEIAYDVINSFILRLWKCILENPYIDRYETNYSINTMTSTDIAHTIQNAKSHIKNHTLKRFSPNTMIVSPVLASCIIYDLKIPYFWEMNKEMREMKFIRNSDVMLYGLPLIEDYNIDLNDVHRMLIYNSNNFINITFEIPTNKKNVIYINDIPVNIIYKYNTKKQIYAFELEIKYKIVFYRPENALLITLKK